MSTTLLFKYSALYVDFSHISPEPWNSKWALSEGAVFNLCKFLIINCGFFWRQFLKFPNHEIKFLVLTYEDNFATLIFEVAKALFCHEVAELACPQKSFLCKGVSKGCDALQSFDGFFTFTGRIAQNHSQVRPPISPICIGTFLEQKQKLFSYWKAIQSCLWLG